MTQWTHIVSTNGNSRGPLTDTNRPFPEQIRRHLSRMDGKIRWAYGLWRTPEGADLLDDVPLSDSFIQCSGSAEALSIEVRTAFADGTGRLDVIGRSSEGRGASPDVRIPRDSGRHVSLVFPDEVFTADEAAEIFDHYRLHDRIPDGYVGREFVLVPFRESDHPRDYTRVPERDLVFLDELGNERTWAVGSKDSAEQSLTAFVEEFAGVGNGYYAVSDSATNEAFVFIADELKGMRYRSYPSRIPELPLIKEFCRTSDEREGMSLAHRFIRGGNPALDVAAVWCTKTSDLPPIPRETTPVPEAAPPVSTDGPLVEVAVRALLFAWSNEEDEARRRPPYPWPERLRPAIEVLQEALGSEDQRVEAAVAAWRRGTSYVPIGAFSGRRKDARGGVSNLVQRLLLWGILSPDEGDRLVEAVRTREGRVEHRSILARNLQLSNIDARLLVDDLDGARNRAARMSEEWEYTGRRRIASYHAVHGDVPAFFEHWKKYEARHDKEEMRKLKESLVTAVARREGWAAARDLCGDRRIGPSFLVHAFAPLDLGYQDLVDLFAGDARGVLAEHDELRCLVAAAGSESRPYPKSDHPGVEELIGRIDAIDPQESTAMMRIRDTLLYDLRAAIGDEATLARVRKLVRTPRLKSDLKAVYTGHGA